MKHQIKVTLYCEVDTDHSEYEGPDDIDSIVNLAEEDFAELKGETNDGLLVVSVHVEAVE